MAHARRPARTRSVFLDPRGEDRAMRVSWHHESGLVTLSLWRGNLCTGTFRLEADEVPALVRMLRAGLEEQYDAASARLRDASA